MMSIFRKNKKQTIYLDHAAATPLSKRVLASLKESLTQDYVNPSGVFLRAQELRSKVENARHSVAKSLACQDTEVIFTEGGSEANNLALLGFIREFRRDFNKKPLVVSSPIEHASVLETLRSSESRGEIDLILVPVSEGGVLDFAFLKRLLREEKPHLMSFGYVNGEIGVIQNIREIAKMVRHHRKHQERNFPFLHTDAVQAVNYCDVNVQRLGVDMMSINASKIYGPKKIGALYKKKTVQLEPLVFGGNQEFALRAGTENSPYVCAFAEALSETQEMREGEVARLVPLRDFFERELEKRISGIIINARSSERIPNIVNVSLQDFLHEEILLRLDAYGIETSMKSACKSDAEGDSHVLHALRDHDTVSLRFSLGRTTTKKDLQFVLEKLDEILDLLRKTRELYLF